MSDKTKKTIAIVIAALFIFGCLLPLTTFLVSAASKSEIQKNLNDKKEQQGDVLEKKKNFDNEIKGIEDTVAGIEASMAQDDIKIEKAQAELTQAEEDLKIQYETYKQRVRVMYMEGSSGYIEAIMQSENITDFLNRYEIISAIAEYDKNIVDRLDAARQAIEDKKTQLELARQQKADNAEAHKKEINKLDAKRQESINVLAELDNDIEGLKKALAKIEAEEAAARAEAVRLSSSGPTVYAGGSMGWPCNYTNVTSPYGYRLHPVLKVNKLHTGTDFGAPYGASIFAANDGTVIKAGFNSAYGNHVIINHGGGISTLYAHASSLSVSVGQSVKRGQTIATVGSTGYSTGAHLHFEVIVNGSTVNPMSYLK